MIKNYFYLVVGLLCLLFGVTHTLNGTSTVLPILDNLGMESNVRTTFTYVWHIIGVENLVFGIALLIMAFQRNMSRVKFAAWLIIAVLTVRWITIATVTLLNDMNAMKLLVTDTVAIFVVIALIWFGTRIKNKVSNE